MSSVTPQIDKSGRIIGNAFYDWLEAEVKTSSTEGDINSYLNDFDTVREGLAGGWDHANNFPAKKLESHLNRLPFWFEGFELDPNDDYQAARLSFAGLMQVSGNYRLQCYMEAVDGEDYRKRRLKVIDIDAQQSVTHRLRDILPKSGNFAKADVSIESFDEQIKRVSAIGRAAVVAVCSRAAIGYDLSLPDSPSARKLKVAQHEWFTLATDAVVLAAKIRTGNLAAVPFLEPRSITTQSGKLHYPLASSVNWAEVLVAK